MMQMLTAGGLTPLTDGLRAADPDNPRGYFEWERIKQLPSNPGLIAEAEGKVVKVISSLLLSLPVNHEYRIVFLRRPIAQIAASQAEMIRRQTGNAPKLPAAAIEAALEAHLRSVVAWLNARAAMPLHWVEYPSLIQQPQEHARIIAQFLGGGLDTTAMAAQADRSLHRNR